MIKENNNGFSLVEIIIVIAIMVLLVGTMAPLMLRFIEKTHVSSDIQLADTVKTAVSTSILDVKVQQDEASQPYLELMDSATGMTINTNSSFLNSESVLRESIEETFGFPANELMSKLRSAHGESNCIITTTNGIVSVRFTCTDKEGTKDTSSGTPENDIVVQ